MADSGYERILAPGIEVVIESYDGIPEHQQSYQCANPGCLADRLRSLQRQHAAGSEPTGHERCRDRGQQPAVEQQHFQRIGKALTRHQGIVQSLKPVCAVPGFAGDPLSNGIDQIAVTDRV